MNNRVGEDRRDLPGYAIRAAIRAGRFRAENPHVRKAGDRAFWGRVPEDLCRAYVAEGEKLLGHVWEAKKISDYLDYFSPGEHKRIPWSGKWRDLLALLMAECCEYRGRFLPDIVNGVFSLCEESTWADPAHFHSCGTEPHVLPDGTDPVPDPDVPIVDLGAGNGAVLLSFALATFGEEFDRISPTIGKRIRKEIRKRFFDPYLERDNLWYLGFETDTSVWSINNWCTDMNECAVFSALAVGDGELARRVCLRASESLDVYVDRQPEDGFCDEGPSYWFGAGGALLAALDLLDRATAGGGEVFRLPRVRAIGNYILTFRAAGRRFLSYADAVATVGTDAGLALYAIGQMFGDGRFETAAREVADGLPFSVSVSPRTEMLRVTVGGACRARGETETRGDFCRYYPGGEALVAKRGSFLLLAKGGYNHESHNHNDIGEFHLEFGGVPVAVDPGKDDYTKNLFDERYRYGIWFTRSENHNVPLPGDREQAPGAEYRARAVCTEETPESVSFSLDLGGAYPAGTPGVRRRMELTERGLAVTDECDGACRFTVMTPHLPEDGKDGILLGPCRLTVSGAEYEGYREMELGRIAREECYERLFRLSFRRASPGTAVFTFAEK